VIKSVIDISDQNSLLARWRGANSDVWNF
jgi:hypothetical protein